MLSQLTVSGFTQANFAADLNMDATIMGYKTINYLVSWIENREYRLNRISEYPLDIAIYLYLLVLIHDSMYKTAISSQVP